MGGPGGLWWPLGVCSAPDGLTSHRQLVMYPVCLVPGQGLFPLQMRVPALAVGRSQGRGPACSTKPSGPSGLCCSPSLAHSPRPPAAPTCPSSPWEPLGLPSPLPHSGAQNSRNTFSPSSGARSLRPRCRTACSRHPVTQEGRREKVHSARAAWGSTVPGLGTALSCPCPVQPCGLAFRPGGTQPKAGSCYV